jgi:hypothetical protein
MNKTIKVVVKGYSAKTKSYTFDASYAMERSTKVVFGEGNAAFSFWPIFPVAFLALLALTTFPVLLSSLLHFSFFLSFLHIYHDSFIY